jgi:hypothetical protein
MYVNKIDETVDIFIDDFYNKVVIPEVSKYYDEANFVKFQKDINKSLTEYFNNIDRKIINDILNNEENTDKLIEYIKKYIGYYLILTIGFFYKHKYETFMNNVIEFSKNQYGYSLKIDNFFNSESNATIIKYYTIIKNMLTILSADSTKMAQIIKNKNYKETIEFLNMCGQEYVDENFKLKSLHGKVEEQAHNIIKTIIVSEIYMKQDKQNVYLFLEQSENITGEFIYIDVVVQSSDIIDYNMIESVLSPKDRDMGLASEIYELLTEYDVYKTQTIDHDTKIINLLNSGLVVPVSEDFLLYHKDSENYDKYIGKLSATSKKKDEPRIKYVINKIETLSEYYSPSNDKEKLESIGKLFDPLLTDVQGAVINHVENSKIMSKLDSSGGRTNEYYNDLKNYMKFPYINFKDFKKEGFSIVTPRSIDTIRSISFDYISNNSKGKSVQFRSSNPNNPLHITGFIIPNKIYDIKCAKLGNIVNLRTIKYKNKDKTIKNGYNASLEIINRTMQGNNYPHLYWKFNLEKDKVSFKNYDVTSKLNTSEQTKMIVVQLYNDIVTLIIQNILNALKNNKISMQHFTKYLNKINGNLIDLSVNTEIYDDFIKTIYLNNLVEYEDKYDTKSDIFTGLTGEVIKLPTYKFVKTSKIEIIKLPKTYEYAFKVETKDQQLVNSICQHNITWDNLMAIKKREPNKFNDRLFAFFLQYVDKTYDNQYICKSCNSLVNIGNFVQEGSYDEDGHFLSFNVVISVPLEDIPEYEKYKSSIRNMEKIVERFANIFKINSLVGASNAIKIRIRQIIKDTIDLLLVHNINLKQTFKQRSENLHLYGINKDYTNLFTFELENNLFVYSSQDKDYYKSIKKNNIYIYLIFFILLELSETQVIYMMGDKICNYYLFTKYGSNLFDGLNIKKGNGNTVVPLRNYKVLCYVLFYMSCLMTRYNLWYYKEEEKKKFNPIVQKLIVHTFVDFLNSVIEVYSNKSHKYVYDVIVNKFFQKLNNTFINDELLEKIKTLEEKKISDKKTKFSIVQNDQILLQHEYTVGNYFENAFWLTTPMCRSQRVFIDKYIKYTADYYHINDVTNCESGAFHKWTYKDGQLMCALCNRTALTKEGSIPINIIKENNYYTTLEKVVKKYCLSGVKCDLDFDKKVDRNKLQKVYLDIKKDRADTQTVNKNIIKKDEDSNTNFINELKRSYGETKKHKEDYFNFIGDFITKIESIVGKDYNVSNQNIFLRYDAYIIDHDHNGHAIDKPIIIIDTNNKITFKNNDPFFDTDVFYYTNNKLDIDVYYDAHTKLLLGYKEKNKEPQLTKKNNIYIKINYSILTLIKLAGYPSKVIKIDEKLEEYENENKDKSDIKRAGFEYIVSDICRNRIVILKKLLTDFQKYIYRFAYNYYATQPDTEEVNYDFINEYKDKVNKIVLSNDAKKINKFLYKWKVIKNSLFFESIHNKLDHMSISKTVNANDISNYDYNGNLILFYLITEMGKLLDANDDKFNSVNLAHLLLNMIITFYDDFNVERLLENNNVKRFSFILKLKDYSEISDDIVGFYGEYNDPAETITKEMKELDRDFTEERDALDMEDINQDFDSDV